MVTNQQFLSSHFIHWKIQLSINQPWRSPATELATSWREGARHLAVFRGVTLRWITAAEVTIPGEGGGGAAVIPEVLRSHAMLVSKRPTDSDPLPTGDLT